MIIGITLLICLIFLAPIMDGLILPEIARQYLPNGVEAWMYVVYFGVALLILIYIYYKSEVDGDQ